LAKTTYLNYFSPSLEVGYSKLFGVEFWLTTLVFFKFNLAKTTYLNYFSSSIGVGYSKNFGVEFWLTTTLFFL
jgi:hypothetical protein